MIKKLNPMELHPGYFFVFDKEGNFELVEVRDASHRPDSWYPNGIPKVEIFAMGWDCDIPITSYIAYDYYFVEVKYSLDPLGIFPNDNRNAI